HGRHRDPRGRAAERHRRRQRAPARRRQALLRGDPDGTDRPRAALRDAAAGPGPQLPVRRPRRVDGQPGPRGGAGPQGAGPRRRPADHRLPGAAPERHPADPAAAGAPGARQGGCESAPERPTVREGEEMISAGGAAMSDTTVQKVKSEFSPHGKRGEKYLASGKHVSMRLWQEQPTAGKPPTQRDYETVGYVISG